VKNYYRELQEFWLPLGLMVIIFGLSSIPGEIDSERLKFLTELDPKLQNLLHVPLFGLLQILWLYAMTKTGRTGTKAMLACFGISLGYRMFDEFHQMLVPGRYASLMDIALNLVGVAGATLLFWLWQRQKRLKCVF
jgi:VanZ family protein